MSSLQTPDRATRPTIFVECTHTCHSDLNTGIQRVVRNILRHAAPAAARHGYEIVPVILENGQLVPVDVRRVLADKKAPVARDEAASVPTREPWQRRVIVATRPAYRAALRGLARALPFEPAKRFIYALPSRFGLAWCLLAPWRATSGLARAIVRVAKGEPVFRRADQAAADSSGARSLDRYASHQGNILILLDSSWHLDIWPPVRRFKQKGGFVSGVIYDLIPITHPHTAVESLVQRFKAWFAEHQQVTDVLVAISRSVMAQIEDYLAAQGSPAPTRHELKLSYFHLGSELDFKTSHGQPREAVRRAVTGPERVFLVVGSIEPRKNHQFILDAFDRVWATGAPVTLTIIGHNAWKTEDLLARIERHPLRGKRLFLLRDVSDDELGFAYDNASALVMASEIEGFGLPVVEALQRGLPVLCSDIPVFREIVEGRATFFGLDSPANLAREIERFASQRDPAERRQRAPQSWFTWGQSAEQLIDVIAHHAEQGQRGTVRFRAQA